MPTVRPSSRWRAGVRLVGYLVAFGLLAGAVGIAVAVLAFLMLGALLGGGLMAVFFVLGLWRYWKTERGREGSSR